MLSSLCLLIILSTWPITVRFISLFSFSKPIYYFPFQKINIASSFKHWSLKFSKLRCFILKKGKSTKEKQICVTTGLLAPLQEVITLDSLDNLSWKWILVLLTAINIFNFCSIVKALLSIWKYILNFLTVYWFHEVRVNHLQ